MTNYIKYPRTLHLPWSKGVTKDDSMLKNTNHFEGKKVIVTIKMDGENTTMYHNHIHARSIDSKYHWSRDYVKATHANIKRYIPSFARICGENMYAKHTIHYRYLEAYFLVFSIWENNKCLSWDDVRLNCFELELKTVPVIYVGIWDEKLIKELYKENYKDDECEGYVVRLYDSFLLEDFDKSIAKYVRKDHVQTDEHWMYTNREINFVGELRDLTKQESIAYKDSLSKLFKERK